ncbi:MAG: hypothetical protein JNJ88_09665 [Planctomycetes bacterium]|nr:hypothetical protein [Planctomycetota bacterium]
MIPTALASFLLLVSLPLALQSAPQDGPRGDRAKARLERIEKRLEKHPELKAKLEEWKQLTPEQRKDKLRQRLQEKLQNRPRAAARLDRMPKLKELSGEFPRVGLRALKHPLRAKRMERILEHHPEAVERLREKLNRRAQRPR